MDPDEALRLLIDALAAGDLPAAREHFTALEEWSSMGGYPPAAYALVPEEER